MNEEVVVVSKTIGGRILSLETGRIGRQANATVICRYGDTMVLSAVTMASTPREGGDFFPLTVDYREPQYAAGKFPGGFFKREGRPSEKEILTSRCIDRPMRPLFPEGFMNEVQVQLKVLSYDRENDPDICAMIAAFASLEISDIPFNGPVAAVRIGRNDGQFVINPTTAQMETGTVNLTIAGTRDAINMVEGGANEEPEDVILQALDIAQEVLREVAGLIEELKQRCGKPKIQFEPPAVDEKLQTRVRELAYDRIKTAHVIPEKLERQSALDAILEDVKLQVLTEMETEFQAAIGRGEIAADDLEAGVQHKKRLAESEKKIAGVVHDLEREILRRRTLDEGLRSDGRRTTEIRPITCEINIIPRAHGSALFTRGQTQALCATTLGTISDEQKIDGLLPEYYKKFLLHYNFPSFSVGEVRPIRGPGRREIGHGALAERALKPVLPHPDDFPYTIRVVSEILESNGSSSMASVCGGSLSLMDAGVPIRAAVAGIAMGLISEDGRYAILSDILGVEDHLGDMDFKVAGTRQGITAFQMDLKIGGISRDIMAQALEQARQGRLHILDIMEQAMAAPRPDISPFAPRIQVINIPVDKIRDVIGPGGKMIRKIISETGAKIDIDDEGRVVIAATDSESGLKARQWIEYLSEEVEVGKIYKGKVTRLVNFGAFVEILPGQEGLVHISALAPHRVNNVEDVVKEGDEIDVKVIEIDDFGRINLSKRDADVELGRIPARSAGEHPDRAGDRGRGGESSRSGDRGRGNRGHGGGSGDRGRGGSRSGGGSHSRGGGGHR
ncbi:MAG TPA: polyribonucleotide nucleotidyltransferase [bacterium]|nr:polyribonucleotide nucleotidyltransferase [bacterium]